MLVFSFIGMKPVEKDVTPGKKVIVTMEEEVEGLEEVVITGIYSRDKNSYTGSASTYSAKELKMVGVQNVIQSLKTLAPAMMVNEQVHPKMTPEKAAELLKELRAKEEEGRNDDQN